MIKKLDLENNCEHAKIGICESCALDAARDAEIAANGCSCGKPYVGVLVDTRTGREYFMCAGFTDLVIKMRGEHTIDSLQASAERLDRAMKAFGDLCANTKSGPQAARPPVPSQDLLEQEQTTTGPEAPSTEHADE